MKKITALTVLLSICCLFLLYTCLGANSNLSEDPVISTDLFQKAWEYHNDENYMQNVFVDKDKGRVVLITHEGGWYVLDGKSGNVLCEDQNESKWYIPGLHSGIIARIEDGAIVMTGEGGSDIFVYDLSTCGILAEIHLDDPSNIYDYTIDIVDEKIVVLRYHGASAFDLFSGELVWDVKDYAIASQRTSGYLKALKNYLFVQGEGEIRSIDPETGVVLFTVNSPSGGMYIGGKYVGIDDLLLAQGVAVENIQDQFLVALDAKTGEILFKISIPDDEYLRLFPIKVVDGRKLLYGNRPASGIDTPGFCVLYEIDESEIRLLWQNEGICSNGIFFDEWLVARPSPEPPDDSKHSSTFYLLDVFTGEIAAEQKFNMYGVTGLYSYDEYLYFLRDHDLIVYKSIK